MILTWAGVTGGLLARIVKFSVLGELIKSM